jgi:hypothetical protein
MNKMNKRKFIIVITTVIAMCFAVFNLVSFLYRKDWEKATSPLPRETVDDLCKSLLLSDRDSLCDDSKNVYAIDFEEIFRERFRPSDEYKDGNSASYNDVETVIGRYKTECQSVVHETNPEFSYFRCFYDLRGDGYWISAFYYSYPDNVLFSIRSGNPEK